MDGTLYPQITQESFSQNVLMDYQESYLFTAPVKDNITLYQPYSEKRLQEIGKVLKITHLIEDPDENQSASFVRRRETESGISTHPAEKPVLLPVG